MSSTNQHQQKPTNAVVVRAVLGNPLRTLRYDIVLMPDLEKLHFGGHVNMLFEATSPVHEIRLHAREMSFASMSCFSFVEEAHHQQQQPHQQQPQQQHQPHELTRAHVHATPIRHPLHVQQEHKVSSYVMDMTNHTVTIKLATPIPVGKAVLSIDYHANLNAQLAGFYYCAYTDSFGKKKYMATTQFEPLDARRAFPCIDEPSEKAVFGITMVVGEHLTALSNMPEHDTHQLGHGLKRVRFMDTPVMSTYLLAFIVGEFDFVQTITEHGVLLRVYTPPGKATSGKYALECGKRSLDYFDDFFNLSYPLPKLDMIAVPEFAMGAMENWGLVTYREVTLLIDPVHSSAQQRQRVCTVVAHELAHQWFGNLVTMAWWDDLWLNEGFATFMQNLASDSINPDWLMWEQYCTDVLPAALALDSLRSSHPIQVPIEHAEDVHQVFDAISYRKGASVIRMAYTVLGAEDFREGLRTYMQRHKYGNTETTDLWTAWSEASGRPIKALMSSWTEQMGYPLLTVSEGEDPAHPSPHPTATAHARPTMHLLVTQQWYLSDGTVGDDRLWTVPLPYAVGSTVKGDGVAVVAVGGDKRSDGEDDEGRTSIPMHSTKSFSLTVPLGAAGANAWVKLNSGQTIPMRVAYSDSLFDKLLAGIKAKSLPVADTAGVLLDTLALVRSGHYAPSRIIAALTACEGSTDPTVWTAISMVVGVLDNVLFGGSAPGYSQFAACIAHLATPVLDTLGWSERETDGHLDRLMRASVISLVGKFSRRDADLAEARRRFDLYCTDPIANAAACPSEYSITIFRMALANGGEKEFLALMAAFHRVTSDIDRKNIMFALGFTPVGALKTRCMDWATSGAIKLQDFWYVFNSVSDSGAEGTVMGWQYFVHHFARLQAMTAASPSLFAGLIRQVCHTFVSPEQSEMAQTFFDTHPVPANKRVIVEVLESIRINAALLARLDKAGLTKAEAWIVGGVAVVGGSIVVSV